MPGCCCAYGCRSGYKKKFDEGADAGVSFHKFPFGNEELLRAWVKNIGRKGFEPKKRTTVICSRHFTEDDFVTERSDADPVRNRKRGQLNRRCLKWDAIPTVFHKDVPQPPQKKRRTNSTTAESRRFEDQVRAEAHHQEQLAADALLDTQDLENRLLLRLLEPFCLVRQGTNLLMILIDISELQVPRYTITATFTESLSVFFSSDGKPLISERFGGFKSGESLGNFSNVEKILEAMVRSVMDVRSQSWWSLGPNRSRLRDRDQVLDRIFVNFRRQL